MSQTCTCLTCGRTEHNQPLVWNKCEQCQRIEYLESEIANYETARQEDAKRMEQVKGERDELFNVAVKSFNAMFEIGVGLAPDELTPRVRALDHALANDLNDELWERINAAALKDAK